MLHTISTSSIRRVLGILIIASGFSMVGQSQTFPNFPIPGIEAPSATPEYALSSATVPNGVYGNAVITTYASTDGNFPAYSVSADGQNYVSSDTLVNLPQVQCSPAFGDLCGVGVASFGGNIYLAYSNFAQELVIVEGTPIPNNVGYSFTVLQTYPTGVPLTTVPVMIEYNQKLLIIFAASSDPRETNAYYQVTCNTVGSQCSAPDESHLGAPPESVASGSTPGLANLNGTLWLAVQQNNSQHNLFTFKSTDGVNWQFVAEDTTFQLNTGVSMVAYNNNLVLADQSIHSDHSLWILMSPDGVNWSGHQYVGMPIGSMPGLTILGNGLALSYELNNGLFGSYASN